MFDYQRDDPYNIQTYRFDIDGWEFIITCCYQHDRFKFQWSEMDHKVCKKPFWFKIHRQEFRGYCPTCDIRMPHTTWEIVKSHLETLKYGYKLQ